MNQYLRRCNHVWIAFRLQLTTLQQLAIPRWLNLSPSHPLVEIYGFSETSTWALTAVVHVRVNFRDEKYLVRLVSAAIMVIPLKRVTIPGLELSAALLLSQLVTYKLNLGTAWTSSIPVDFFRNLYFDTFSSFSLEEHRAALSRVIQELLPSESCVRYHPNRLCFSWSTFRPASQSKSLVERS